VSTALRPPWLRWPAANLHGTSGPLPARSSASRGLPGSSLGWVIMDPWERDASLSVNDALGWRAAIG
jgi:hypothetical protein